ncbi:helix-turn-helix domain-containing protein [Phytohabitans aurantiacus]|nr:helix-turn-helix transcriptional regulator [Phytohabitans aurantiacus]
MRWNLRMRAAQQGIWKSTEMRRRLAEAGLQISHGKMSALWTGTPTTVRLDDLEVICVVLQCEPSDLLICEPERVTSGRPEQTAAKSTAAAGQLSPRLGRNRTLPPA